MHKVPNPKEQARLLKAFLATVGLDLPHQASLEAVAKTMGFKNWKTMSAQAGGTASAATSPVVDSSASAWLEEHKAMLSRLYGNLTQWQIDELLAHLGRRPGDAGDPKTAPEVQAEIPGPADGLLFEVPVTVDVTMTAAIQARGDSREEAIANAEEYASKVYPRLFELDEANYRRRSDFYCPDDDAPVRLEPQETPDLTEADFAEKTLDVSNNMGLRGEFSIRSKDGSYLLEGTLDPLDPDNSNDNLRSKCVLTIALIHASGPQQGTEITCFTEDYVFGGNDKMRGDHLEKLFHDGELLDKLFGR